MAEGAPVKSYERYQCSNQAKEKHLLNDPIMFPCKHHFCKGCIDINILDKKCANGGERVEKETPKAMPPNEGKKENQPEKEPVIPNEGKENILEVVCPVCKRKAKCEDIKAGEVMKKIVAAYEKVSSGDRNCPICNSESSEFRCKGCKQEMCDNCKDKHSNFDVLKGHMVEVIGEHRNQVKVDSARVCQEHKKEMEMNCIEDKKIMCFMCHMTNPCDHKPKTIDKSLEILEPEVREKLKPVELDIAFLIKKTQDLNNLERNTNEQVENILNEIELKRVEINKIVDKNAVEVKKEVKGIGSEKVAEIDAERCLTQDYLKWSESVKMYADNCLDHLEGVHRLSEVQGDLMETLTGYELYDKNTPLVDPLKKEVQFAEHRENLVAIVKDKGVKVPQIHEQMQMLEKELQNIKQSDAKKTDEYKGKLKALEDQNKVKDKKSQDLEALDKKLQEESKNHIKKVKEVEDAKIIIQEESGTKQKKIEELDTLVKKKTEEIQSKEAIFKKLQDEKQASAKQIQDLQASVKKHQAEIKDKEKKAAELKKESDAKGKKIQELEAANLKLQGKNKDPPAALKK